MNTAPLIAQHLLDVFTGGNWTEVSVADVIGDLTFEEATALTPASANTIAAIIHHLSFWNSIMTERLQGKNPHIPESNGFDVSEINTGQDWKLLLKDMLASASQLAVAIHAITEQRLQEPIYPGKPSVYKSVQGTVEHVHYHLGQMIVIKNWLKQKANEP